MQHRFSAVRCKLLAIDCSARHAQTAHRLINHHTLLLFLHAIPAKRGKGRPADKLQVKAAKFLPLVGLARSKHDPINRGHGAQYLYRPPPAEAFITYPDRFSLTVMLACAAGAAGTAAADS